LSSELQSEQNGEVMTFRLALFALLTAGSDYGAIRVRQILQVPSGPQQTLRYLTADQNGDLIATGNNGNGAFIDKLDGSGNLIFTLSEQGAYPSGAVADANGDVYWIGSAGTPVFPFPFTKFVLGTPPAGSLPGFVVKFHGADGSIAWATALGAMQPAVISAGGNGQVTVAGIASAPPGITTPGAYQSPTIGTAGPIEIIRLSADGDVVFAAAYGGHTVNTTVTETCQVSPGFINLSCPRTDVGAILLDSQGNIWIAGSTNTTDLPMTSTALKNQCGCSRYSGDGFLAEISADGSRLLYATYLGTSTQSETDMGGSDVISAAALDSAGRIWLAGSTNGTDLPVTPNANQAELEGDGDGFVIEYDPAVNQILFATYYGAEASSYISNIAIGSDGIPMFAGRLGSSPSDWYNSGHDFIASLNPSGIQVALLPRNAAGTGLAATPFGSGVVAGSASVATVIETGSDTSPSIFAVTNSGVLTDSGQVSPGEIISIFGTNIGPATPLAAGMGTTQTSLATQLAGVQVLFDGVAAPLLYVSTNQINAIVPFWTIGQKTTKLVVNNSGVSSNGAQLGVVTATPGVFTTQSEYHGYPVAVALNEDGTINGAGKRATPGSVVALYATGLGALSPQPADGTLLVGPALPALQQTVLVGSGGFLDVLYAGPAEGQVAGAMLVKFRLPSNVADTPPIILFVGTWISQYFTVWVSGT
jgi:uncharacterized protein (TIGR03437 family)